MAIKGDVGKIMFENAGGTEADVGQTRSWSLSITKDTMETTKQGDTFKSNIGGLIAGEGSAELLYNPSETGAGYTTFIDDVLTTGDNADYLNYFLIEIHLQKKLVLQELLQMQNTEQHLAKFKL